MAVRLIDAGMSRRGWSRISQFIACPMLAAAKRLGHVQRNRDALDKGTLGHTAQAHLHTIEGVKEGPVLVNGEWVEDASDFADPIGAMRLQAAHNPSMQPHLGTMTDVFNGYMDQREAGVGFAHMVEQEVVGILGIRHGISGLHLVDTEQWDLLNPSCGEPAPVELRHHDGSTITVQPLDMPGHPRHGWPIYISRRMDLVRKTGSLRRPMMLVEDHKHQARIDKVSDIHSYRAEDGFVAMDMLAQQHFGPKYGGLLLNLICTSRGNEGAQRRVKLPGSASKRKAFALNLWYHEMELAKLEVWAATGVLPFANWPRRGLQNGGKCVGRYGKCDLYGYCHDSEPLNIVRHSVGH